MVSQGLFVRRADPHDGRRVFVELAPAASTALRRYFAEVGKAASIWSHDSVGDSMWPRFLPGRPIALSPRSAVAIGDEVAVR